MATPPFDPNAASPAASDLIQQFPADEQTFRDIIESWLLTLSDRDGNILFSALEENIADYLTPTGAVVAYAGLTPPVGWAFAAGQAISRSTFSDLFAVTGTQFGAGNGTTTFNVPDLRSRAIFGLDNVGGFGDSNRVTTAGSGIDANTRGASGGAQNVTLTVAEMPAHTHSNGTLTAASAGAHTHTVSGTAASAGAHTHTVSGTTNATGNHNHGFGIVAAPPNDARDWTPQGTELGGVKRTYETTSAGSHSHTVSGTAASAGAHTHSVSGTAASNGAHTHNVTGATSSNGSGDAHNNMPPALILAYIIKL